jgi:4-amino-4-deoxy-L-arabinose transferase-like glycosyltransferase
MTRGTATHARTALLLVAGTLLFHLVYAGFVGLSPQEAYYWSWSRRLALSYYDHPPLASWTVRLTTALLGQTERGIRAAAAIHGALFAAFLFLAGRRLFGERAALLALVFALVAPITGLGQVIVTPDVALLSGWMATLYFAVRALDTEDGRWLLAAGVAAGLAALGKYTAFILLPQILLTLLLDPRGRRMLAGPWPWLGVGLAVAVFSPVLIWNAERGWVSFLFQSSGRTSTFAFRPVLVGRFVGLQAAMISPLLWISCLAAAAVAARRWREPSWRVAAVFSVPLLAVMFVVSPFHWVKGNWGAPAYPAALLAGAALALERWDRLRGWTWATGIVAGLASIYMHVVPLVPALPFPARDDTTTGWRQLAARVEAERARLGGDPLIVGCTYKPAAELSFNLPGQPEVQSGGLFGVDGLQYDEWLDPAEVRGREVLLVVDPREKDACRARETLCRPLEELAAEPVYRGGSLATTFRLFRCAVPADAGIALPRWRGGTR